jgi:hypothetical protein
LSFKIGGLKLYDFQNRGTKSAFKPKIKHTISMKKLYKHSDAKKTRPSQQGDFADAHFKTL